MKIDLLQATIRDLVAGYRDDGEGGVVGYGGNLDIRPPYQREFIYKDKQRNAVIETIQDGFPLNVMYWSSRNDGTFEVMDGQQRTISISQYVEGEFSVGDLYYHNLPKDKRDQLLDYELMVYVCSGTESEKLAWFRTINIAGEKLTDQELLNAVYVGSWVADAKRYFSRNGCIAYGKGSDYMKGSPIRQDYLETAIKWISKGKIEDYMGRHQDDSDAEELWEYFESVIDWVAATFDDKGGKMRGVDWGSLYDRFKDDALPREAINAEVKELHLDDDVTNKAGIYPYVLTREEKHLNIRAFTEAMKRKAYIKQEETCNICGKKFGFKDMEGDHITPWIEGGPTKAENCQMLCRECNRRKSSN